MTNTTTEPTKSNTPIFDQLEKDMADGVISKDEEAQLASSLLGNHLYDVLKFIALYVISPVAFVWYTVGTHFGWSFTGDVLWVITGIGIVLAAVLGVGNATYQSDGTVKIDTSNPTSDKLTVIPNGSLSDLANKSQVTFDVHSAS